MDYKYIVIRLGNLENFNFNKYILLNTKILMSIFGVTLYTINILDSYGKTLRKTFNAYQVKKLQAIYRTRKRIDRLLCTGRILPRGRI